MSYCAPAGVLHQGAKFEEYQIQIVRPWSATMAQPADAPMCYDTCSTVWCWVLHVSLHVCFVCFVTALIVFDR